MWFTIPLIGLASQRYVVDFLRAPQDPLFRRKESFRGMFKGLNAYMLHIVPNIMIVFGIYEAVLSLHADLHD